MHIDRVDISHPDLLGLVRQLDQELAERDGADHEFYNQFNGLESAIGAVVLYADKQAVACGAIKALDQDDVELKRMYTHPNYRGHGYAKSILSALEAWSKELNFKRMVLETGLRQVEAIGLYQSCGYTRTANYGPYVGDSNSRCFEKFLNESRSTAIQVFDSRADEYQKKYMNLPYLEPSLDYFLQSLNSAIPEVLDVGCGPGNMDQYLLSKKPGLSIVGTDVSPRMIELAKKNNPQADYSVMDIRDVGTIDQLFDGVFCGFVLAYINKADGLAFIEDAYQMLHPNGVLYISTQVSELGFSDRIKDSNNQGPEIEVYYHGKNALLKTLENQGFVLLKDYEWEPETYSGGLFWEYALIAKKK